MEDDEDTITNSHIRLMQLCSENDELEKFQCESVRQLIEYKWETFGRDHHFVGCIMHLLNTLFIIIYIILSYLDEDDEKYSVILLALSVSYPFYYESYQLSQNGFDYFADIWNYADASYIVMSCANVYIQITLGPFHTSCRMIMCLIILMVIMKSFFYLRIFPALTPIVVMINSVIYDLRIFMFFYMLLVSFFCLVFAVLGLGNEKVHNPEERERRLLKGGGGGGGFVSNVSDNGGE